MVAGAPHAAIPKPNPEGMRAFLNAFVDPGEVYELRIPETRRGPARLFGKVAGYFNDAEAAVSAPVPITDRDSDSAGRHCTATGTSIVTSPAASPPDCPSAAPKR